MNALVHQESRAVGAAHSFDEMERMASVLAQSGLFGVKNPTQALALMLVAQAEGEHPATVAQDYDIIQGKGSRKTHSVLARFQAMGGSVQWHELTHTRAEATFSHPKGGSLRLDWTIEQAKNAGLVGKDNWKGYARAMLRARLIAEGVRAVYPAAIGGFQVPEEAMGPQLGPSGPKDMGPADVVGAPPPPPAPECWPADLFAQRLPEWHKAIQSKKAAADAIVAKAKTKHPLTPEQEAAIRNVPKAEATDVTPKGETPAVSYARLADRLTKCSDSDTAALILDEGRALPEDQQQDLSKLYAEKFGE